MLDQSFPITVMPPAEAGKPYVVSTVPLGGHVDVQYAETAEQAERLKAEIGERIRRAAETLGGCEAG
ncbi:hypothetical protein U8607_11140 [Methylobacterium durans]|uniref:hypothetical protein n=1 Tax=Methylobacterium durans TaxID=2202825 RepID=UPI002AFE95EA|nr:hypothetical protein [Methylobacterium durans]MEA1832635.1 hypothetical protein [Methylobacterium durans]